MNYNEIKDLIETVSKTDLTNFFLEVGDVKIELERRNFTPSSKMVTPIVNMEAPTQFTQQVEPTPLAQQVQFDQTTTESNTKGTPVLSPIVGTFYKASSPTAEAFVKVGQKVSKGDVLYIIEAMKVINEITSDVDGEVLEILVEDSQFVEFNQHIMTIG